MTEIVLCPAPILSRRCVEIEIFDSEIEALKRTLCAAAAKSGRLGVAAPQIGFPLRAFAAHQGRYHTIMFFANPELTIIGDQDMKIEGCLSLPGLRFEVARWDAVIIDAKDEMGEHFTVRASGLDAQILQHECDHLSGLLIIDRVMEQLPHLPRQRRRAMERELSKVPH